MIRVLVVDDHERMRTGLQGLLATVDDIQVVGAAADGAEFLVQLPLPVDSARASHRPRRFRASISPSA
jgi:DNA-binding NarL/FixJ family response regulator